MARIARQISQSGLYHIVFRGVNRQHIFEEEADYIKLKEILMNLKMDMGFEIYGTKGDVHFLTSWTFYKKR